MLCIFFLNKNDSLAMVQRAFFFRDNSETSRALMMCLEPFWGADSSLENQGPSSANLFLCLP